MTYGQLETMVARVGSWLVKHQRVSKGNVVLFHSINCLEFPVMTLAVASTGAIASFVNPAYTVSTYEHLPLHWLLD